MNDWIYTKGYTPLSPIRLQISGGTLSFIFLPSY